jgi:hypothetical protein
MFIIELTRASGTSNTVAHAHLLPFRDRPPLTDCKLQARLIPFSTRSQSRIGRHRPQSEANKYS